MASNSSGLIKMALFGGAAYVAYRYFVQPAMSPAAAAPAPSTAGNMPAVIGTPTPVPQTGTTLDSTYAQLKAAVAGDADVTGSGDAAAAGVDTWNFYLGQVLNIAPPAPETVGIVRGNKITAAQYWAAMAPWLAANKGLHGLGLYGSLGVLARQQLGW